MCICMYARVCVYVYMYVCTCVCICVYVCMHVCVYLFTYIKCTLRNKIKANNVQYQKNKFFFFFNCA